MSGMYDAAGVSDISLKAFPDAQVPKVSYTTHWLKSNFLHHIITTVTMDINLFNKNSRMEKHQIQ